MRTVDILGIKVHNCDEDGAVAAIRGFLEAEPHRVRQVVTVNPEFVMEARCNAAFRDVLNNAGLATPDGAGVVAAARLLGTPVEGRAAGVGLVNRLAALSGSGGYRLFLLGAAPGVAEQAASELVRRYPGACIVGTYAGSPQDRDFPEISRLLEAARPDALLVAYGAPAQDLWIARHREDFPRTVKVAMGVGGVFDYLSGRVPLAPTVMRRLGLEWLYRLYRQPWRWRRILRVFAFGGLVLVEAARNKISGKR